MNPKNRPTGTTTGCSRLAPLARVALLALLAPMASPGGAAAQVCPGTTLTSELKRPMGMALSNQGNVIVSETGTLLPHSGRLSIVDAAGTRRTLLDGLPSGLNDIAEPSGPAGLVMRGRTVYLLLGVGDSVLPAPVPTRHLPNPDVSSPLYSSVLAIHFNAHVEKSTSGFTLSLADQQTLADGGRVILSNGGGDTIEIELVTNFPDYLPDPLPGFPAIVRSSNPFGLALVADQLYVTDGSLNLVWTVDIPSGTHATLATFGTIPNPLPIGPPVVEPVPTGIHHADGRLLVTLFRGVPFPPGTSVVVEVDPSTGAQTTLIGGLKTAIGVLRTDPGYLVLQHSSGAGPFFPGPGVVLQVDSAGATPNVLADCLARPTAMLETGGILYISEMLSGRIVALRID